MSINVSFYGEPTTFLQMVDDVNLYVSDTGNRKSKMYSGSISDLTRSSKIVDDTPLDESICYCGFDDNAPFKKIKVHYRNEKDVFHDVDVDNGLYVGFARGVNYNTFTGNMFYSNYDKYSNATDYPKNVGWYPVSRQNRTGNRGSQSEWADVSSNYDGGWQIITKFAPMDFRIVPIIYYTQSAVGTTSTPSISRCDLKTYCTTVYQNYPYVTGIGLYSYDSLNKDVAYSLRATTSRYVSPICFGSRKKIKIPTAYKTSEPYDEFTVYSPIFRDLYLTYTSGSVQAITSTLISGTENSYHYYSRNELLLDNDFYETEHYKKSDTYLYSHHVTDVNEFREYVRKCCAYTGLLFCETYADITKTIYDSATFCGIIDSNGITHGDYTQGIDNLKNTQVLSSDIHSDIKYIPGGGGGGESDFGNLSTTLNTGGYTTSAKYYVCTASEIKNLISYLNNEYLPTNDELISDFKGTNPIDYITNVMYYPFDVPYIPLPTVINIGKLETPIQADMLKTNYGIDNLFDYGSFNIPYYFNDFRDFSATTISLYCPFCGNVQLDTKMFVGHTLSVKLVVDFVTGHCTTLIYRDSLLIETVSGVCGVSIPISLKSMSDYQNTLQMLSNEKRALNRNAIFGIGASIGATAMGAMTGNPLITGGGISGIIKTADTFAQNKSKIDYEISHAIPSIGSVGASSPVNDFIMEYAPRIIITRSQTLSDTNTDVYSNTVGNSCDKQGIVSDFSGKYIVCSDSKLSVSCTDTEIQLINSSLTSGVYV